MCKVYTGYCGTSEIEHGLCACTVDNPLAKARGLSLRTGAQTMLYLPHFAIPLALVACVECLNARHLLPGLEVMNIFILNSAEHEGKGKQKEITSQTD